MNAYFSSPAVAIRPLRASDAATIAAAFAAIGWSKPREQYVRYLAEQKAGERQVWVAEADARFAGYVTLVWRPDYTPFRDEGIPEIQDLNVLPAFRRRGIAAALLDAAEAAARERVAVVGLAVGLGADYGPAQRLYVQRGYVPDGRGIAWRGRTVEYGARVTVDEICCSFTPWIAVLEVTGSVGAPATELHLLGSCFPTCSAFPARRPLTCGGHARRVPLRAASPGRGRASTSSTDGT